MLFRKHGRGGALAAVFGATCSLTLGATLTHAYPAYAAPIEPITITYIDPSTEVPENQRTATITYTDDTELIGGYDTTGNTHYPTNMSGYPAPAFNSFPSTKPKLVAWTAPDGSYIHGGVPVSTILSRIDENRSLTLTAYRVDMSGFNFDPLQPNILTTIIGPEANQQVGPTDFETAGNPAKVDQSQTIRFKSVVYPENMRDSLVALWGRSDTLFFGREASGDLDTLSEGNIVADVDSRLKFSDNIEVFFASNWVEPDSEKLAAKGITVTEKTITVDNKEVHGYSYTIPLSVVESSPIVDESYRRIEIPVRIVDKATWDAYDLDTFLKPIVFTVADDFDRGINAVLDEETYNSIATSDDPIVKVRGGINLTIASTRVTKFWGFKFQLSYTLSEIANPEYLELHPTGYIHVEDVDENGEQLASFSLAGRALNPAGTASSDNYQSYVSLYDPEEVEDPAVDVTNDTPDGNINNYAGVKNRLDVYEGKRLASIELPDGETISTLKMVPNSDGTLSVEPIDEATLKEKLQHIALSYKSEDGSTIYTSKNAPLYKMKYVSVGKPVVANFVLDGDMEKPLADAITVAEDKLPLGTAWDSSKLTIPETIEKDGKVYKLSKKTSTTGEFSGKITDEAVSLVYSYSYDHDVPKSEPEIGPGKDSGSATSATPLLKPKTKQALVATGDVTSSVVVASSLLSALGALLILAARKNRNE